MTKKENNNFIFNLENVKKIHFYDNKQEKNILTLFLNDNYNIFYDSKTMMGDNYRASGLNIKNIILKNPVLENKRKENFKLKENYILNNKEKYFKTTDLYINVNIEGIIIEQEAPTEEHAKEWFTIYNNYIIKNFNVEIWAHKHQFYTQEDVDAMDWKTYKNNHIKSIDEILSEEKTPFNFAKKHTKALKIFYENKKNDGFLYRGYAPTNEKINKLYYKLYDKQVLNEAGKQKAKNTDFIKNNCGIDYIKYDIIKVLELLKIDICVDDLEKMAAERTEK